jgi:methylated-DNA-[protein]-cysteine S-methyltransferase
MDKTIFAVNIPSQFGEMTLTGGIDFLSHLYFPGEFHPKKEVLDGRGELSNLPMLAKGVDFLYEYFAGNFGIWNGVYMPKGTDFQMQIWEQTRQIAPGSCQTYGNLASAIDKPKAARAVGMAMAKNPLPIIIPCHRVIGQNGKLTGFGGGLDLKRSLLAHEGYKVVK